MFDKQLKVLSKIFVDETTIQLIAIEDLLLKIENEGQKMYYIDETFRLLHSLKGAAVSMGYKDISAIIHHLEDLLILIKNEWRTFDLDVLSIFYESIQVLEQIKNTIEMDSYSEMDINSLIRKIDILIPSKKIKKESDKFLKTFVFRISEYEAKVIEDALKRKLSVYLIEIKLCEETEMKEVKALLIEKGMQEIGQILRTLPEELEKATAEDVGNGFKVLLITLEMRSKIIKNIKQVGEVGQINVHAIRDNFRQDPLLSVSQEIKPRLYFRQHTRNEFRVGTDKLNNLLVVLRELLAEQKELEIAAKSLRNRIGDGGEMDKLTASVQSMHRFHDILKDTVTDIRACSIENVFSRFPWLVRDLSRSSGKMIQFDMTGNDVVMDKAIIELIVDPIVHLLRNAIDHGIESRTERIDKGKPELGQILLSVRQKADCIIVEVRDDGKGISPQVIRQKAVGKGIISARESKELSDKDVVDLIFRPGFSTAEVISEISGRGVGMDVVKTNIEKLGGHIDIQTGINEGTYITMVIPTAFSVNLSKKMI